MYSQVISTIFNVERVFDVVQMYNLFMRTSM